MEELNSSPLQFNLFYQMKIQIKYFIDLITDKKNNLEKKQNRSTNEKILLLKYKKCIDVYSQELLKIDNLIEEKEKVFNLTFSKFITVEKLFDGVSDSITSFCRKRNSLQETLPRN